ncbi:MAG: 50S ribosomal protein L1 [Patescibacteria group bacterium]|nr:50S ribosomal protein L1 [Patescibacteria group bacterium]
MGKIRTRILGLEEVEKKQKEEQKKRASEKKKVRAPGLKGGERMTEVEVKETDVEKMEKAKKIIEEETKTKKEEKKTVKKSRVRGKKYQSAKKQIDPKKEYSLLEAVQLLKKIKYAKFDESVELHLNIDEVGLKGEVEFPYSIGKTIRVAIVDDKVLAEIEKGKLDFDVLITHPQYMPKLVKFAKILGPKGLMPNPKAGTISPKPEEVAKKFEKGTVRWKTESKFPLIHQLIGKISLEEKKLVENAKAFLNAVGIKHIQSTFIKTTMSPALKIDLKSL